MAQGRERRPGAPPRWLLRMGWALHRIAYRLAGGRLGLRWARPDRLGVLRLRTLGRRSGEERATMLYYVEDGDDLVVVASNGGADTPPAWWLNLQAAPEAFVDLPDGIVAVTARPADAAAAERLWPRLTALGPGYAAYAQATDRHLDVVILQPGDGSQPDERRA